MAKKRNIDGILFYPRKNHIATSCNRCGRSLPSNKKAYEKRRGSNEFYCGFCMEELSECAQKELKENVLVFPLTETVFVGKKGHICTGTSKNMVPVMAQFFGKGKKLETIIYKCSGCGKYIMGGKTYDNNSELLVGYKLIRTRTGKEIIHYNFSLENTTKLPPKKVYKEIPANVRWAATHPFQGGDCIGK